MTIAACFHDVGVVAAHGHGAGLFWVPRVELGAGVALSKGYLVESHAGGFVDQVSTSSKLTIRVDRKS